MFDGKQVGSRSVDGVVSLSLFLKRSTLMGSMFFMFNSKGFLSKCYLFFFNSLFDFDQILRIEYRLWNRNKIFVLLCKVIASCKWDQV